MKKQPDNVVTLPVVRIERFANGATMQVTQEQTDAGADALRQKEQGGNISRTWDQLPNGDKKKWREKSYAVIEAAFGVSANKDQAS